MRLIILAVICMCTSTDLAAQTYSNLWHQVESAQKADLPQDELAALHKIEKKAQKDKEYGHLLKAQLQAIATQADVSPDSLAPMVNEYAAYATQGDNDALKAVYCATLGHIYTYCSDELGIDEKEAAQTASDYYKQALAQPELLAKTKARTLEPFAVPGANSTIFNNDLLHLVAFEAHDYQTMIDYYKSVDNRSAACIASLYKLREERTNYEEPKKSKYLAQVDSLIHDYYDLDVAGELAIEHFNVMDSSPDVSAEEKIEFIDDALVRWQNWPRMVVLKNARTRITLPSYNIDIPETLTIPGREIPVYITSLKNLQSIQMSVYRVNISGDENYDPDKNDDYKTLLSKRDDKPIATDSRTYYGLPEYREIRDTLVIAPLPLGVYLVEFSTDNSGVATERVMLNITNLRVIDMNLPGDKMRLIAVDATSGKPVPNANISIKFREWKDKQWQEDDTTLTTEDDGEVLYSSTISPYKYRVTTADDKAFPWQTISRRTWSMHSQETKTANVVKLYSDRAIYRPNQTVQVSALAYTTYSQENWEVDAKKKLHLILRDAKNNTVSEKDVTTDEWGVAATAFDLPADAGSGYYSVRATADGVSGTCSFRVEEYKRPTFTIDIDDYKEQYKAGDTIIVKAWAKTYSGVPVVNAKVAYSVKTELNMWWRRWVNGSKNAAETLATEETTTANDGSFLLKVPIAFPSDTKKGGRFARVTLSAQVTSLAGETHSATNIYPLSDQNTTLDLSGFEEKQCREDMKPFSFVYLNNAGKEVDDVVSYTIDDNSPSSVPTNSNLQLPATLPSGAHLLKATCQNDTIEQAFIVFSLDDKVAPVDTTAWYYSTTGQEKNYVMQSGKAEYIQFGTSRADQTVFYAIASDTVLLESGQLQLSDELVKREFIYKEEWGNGIAIRYSWVRDGKLYTYSESLSRPVKDCSLDVAFKTFRDHLTPGEQEEWTITITNPDGSPAKAQLMAVLFDKSLDALHQHDWSLTHKPYYLAPTIYQSAAYNVYEQFVYGEQSIRYITEPSLTFYSFDFPALLSYHPVFFDGLPTGGVFHSRTMKFSMAGVSSVENMPSEGDGIDLAYDSDISVRENLSETAFFMPQLVTDKAGNVDIKFTLPESLTTWRFMSLAHDKSMNVGRLLGEAVAQKRLMIEPNMPRFIREGDKGQLSATISNNTNKATTVEATIVITDPETEKVVFKASQACDIEAESSVAVTFDLPSLAANVYTCVVTAQAGKLSDGEQHYLPVLSNDVEVVTTRAFTQTTAGDKVINLTPLYGKNATDASLQVDYTDNPAWLLLEALPVVAAPEVDNAVSLAVALYANTLTEDIKARLPQGVLTDKMPFSTAELSQKLRLLQNENGSFSWFAGMLPSTYITHTVVKLLVRMKHLGLAIDRDMLSRAIVFLDREMASYVEKLRKMELENGKKALPDDLAMDYLYLQALADEPLEGAARDNAEYLLSCVKDCSASLTIYGKANFAVIFARHPVDNDLSLAQTFLESVRQYSVYTDEMGRYFDTPKALYSWHDYKIPTQTAAIEAFQTVAPSDATTISELQQWLLQEKRTQQWDTPINSAEAIYAFFNGWMGFKDSSLTATALPTLAATQLFVDGKQVSNAATVEGEGRISVTLQGRYREFIAQKSSGNISWGAVSVTCTQPLGDVVKDGEYLSIDREVVAADGEALASPRVGQKVMVRITLTTQRDLDFVEVTDNRPACLEPGNQLSGYRDGCYVSVRDTKTVYYFDRLPKGKHVVETEYYIDRNGDYHAGLTTAKCSYAPEYQAREGAYEISVETSNHP